MPVVSTPQQVVESLWMKGFVTVQNEKANPTLYRESFPPRGTTRIARIIHYNRYCYMPDKFFTETNVDIYRIRFHIHLVGDCVHYYCNGNNLCTDIVDNPTAALKSIRQLLGLNIQGEAGPGYSGLFCDNVQALIKWYYREQLLETFGLQLEFTNVILPKRQRVPAMTTDNIQVEDFDTVIAMLNSPDIAAPPMETNNALVEQQNQAIADAEQRAREAADNALIEQQNQAIADAEQRAREAADEVTRLKAQQEAEINRQVLARGPVTEKALITEAQQELGIDVDSDYNLLITGDSNAGKSSTINIILGLNPNDPGAAAVGVTETTGVLAKYASPENPHVKLWEAPGAGTKKFPIFHPENPDLHYYRRFKVYAFDCVIIFYSGRLLDGAATLAQVCHKGRQPVAIVRNKADSMVEDLIEDGIAKTDEEAKRKARQAFEIELRHNFGDLAIPRFLVSMKRYKRGICEFDEVALIEYIRQAAISQSGAQ